MLPHEEVEMFVGIDWAADTHAICVEDAAGRVVDRFTIEHSAEGFERLVGRLARHGDPAALPVAIERPDGRLVDRLLEAGHPVVPVKTTAIKAWREAEVGSGAKSDPGDARVIAEYLRLRGHDLRALHPFSAETRALRAVVRTRSDLVTARVAAGNQLSATLAAFWPGAGEVFADVWSGIGLAFLEQYPTPTAAGRLGEVRMAGFLRKHGYSGRRTPAELLGRLRVAPTGLDDGPESEARRDTVLAMVRVLRALNASIRDLDRSVAAHLGEHPDAEVFRSLPRAGVTNAAQMLAEWGDCREAYDGPEAVAALSGMAPVTRRSGKHLAVGFRWACNKRFRNAMTTFADNSRHASPWAAAVYAAAIDRGADHPHAVRILARAWIRVIHRCWLDHVAYDPAKHRGATRLEVGSQVSVAA
ncbi:MAG TPA: IS110 family transposase [Candidatus Lustribacter sp.]|nr:IS110 family transposase [Candidatus Lustribacter sp.]